MARTYRAFIGTQSKGLIYRKHGRLHWERTSIKHDGSESIGGVESYSRAATLDDVAAHIARLCLVPREKVVILPLRHKLIANEREPLTGGALAEAEAALDAEVDGRERG